MKFDCYADRVVKLFVKWYLQLGSSFIYFSWEYIILSAHSSRKSVDIHACSNDWAALSVPHSQKLSLLQVWYYNKQ